MGRAARARRFGVVPTGVVQTITPERAARWPDQVPGVHLWNLMSIHRLSDKAARECATGTRDGTLLDSENLLSIVGPGCLWCEEPWTPELADRPCPGDVSA